MLTDSTQKSRKSSSGVRKLGLGMILGVCADMVMPAKVDVYIREITEALQPLNPLQILLFGSYARGDFTEDSDIDLLIILVEDFVPQTYAEKIKLRVAARTALRQINDKIALDVLVYTKPEYEKILEDKGVILTEIIETGKSIYEKAS